MGGLAAGLGCFAVIGLLIRLLFGQSVPAAPGYVLASCPLYDQAVPGGLHLLILWAVKVVNRPV